ncbi:MAG: radical SAM protein [Bacillota bacterium]
MQREKFIDVNNFKILVSKIAESEQEQDLSKKATCNGYARTHHFKREVINWVEDPLPIDPANHYFGKTIKENLITAEVFQMSYCNMDCWYCFVPDNLKQARVEMSKWMSCSEIIDELEKYCLGNTVIDLSGGNPELTPEWPLWLLREIEKRGLSAKYYVWSDDTLSSCSMELYLSTDEIHELASYRNYGKVCCFKGFNEYSYTYNSGISGKNFLKSFDYLKRYIDYGFDVYGYITLTIDTLENLENEISNFFDLVESRCCKNFLLRIIPLKIFIFAPTKNRLDVTDCYYSGINNQEKVLDAWVKELGKRFSKEELTKSIVSVKIR